MSWARLIIAPEILARMLHLEEHGIQIDGALLDQDRALGPAIVLSISGDGLPGCEVIGLLRQLEDGREILIGLEPVK